jgi:inorganic pyrophosphatase
MTHFFTVYKSLENKETVVDEVKGKEDALRIIESCIKNYQEKFNTV